MHAPIQQRVDGVAALHVRSRIATAEFYALIGKEPPRAADSLPDPYRRQGLPHR